MKKLIVILSSILAVIIVLCNILVLSISHNRCYDDVSAIPASSYGILLGTGRSHEPSPYYDARVQAAIDLYQAGKISIIYISGENDVDGYHEVDEMHDAIKTAIPDANIMCDTYGTNTRASLEDFGDVFGYRSSVTIISQEFHNKRAVFIGSLLFEDTPIAYNAADTDRMGWRIRNTVREWLARTKEVITIPIMLL